MWDTYIEEVWKASYNDAPEEGKEGEREEEAGGKRKRKRGEEEGRGERKDLLVSLRSMLPFYLKNKMYDTMRYISLIIWGVCNKSMRWMPPNSLYLNDPQSLACSV